MNERWPWIKSSDSAATLILTIILFWCYHVLTTIMHFCFLFWVNVIFVIILITLTSSKENICENDKKKNFAFDNFVRNSGRRAWPYGENVWNLKMIFCLFTPGGYTECMNLIFKKPSTNILKFLAFVSGAQALGWSNITI